MYLKDIKFKDVDNNITIGKAIRCVKLKRILNKLPMDYLITTNLVGNITVMDKDLNDIGYIDIAEDIYHEYDGVKE